jgi:tetratricopeptide (TPR) repeat protein
MNTEERLAQALDHSLGGEYTRAVAEYDAILRVDPACAFALCGRGYCRRALGDFDGAIADLLEGMRLEPALAAEYDRYASRAYVERAERSSAADRHHAAVEDFSKALQIHIAPTGWPGYIHYLRGNCRLHIGDTRGALDDYDEALRLGYTGYQDCVIRYQALATSLLDRNERASGDIADS